MYNKTHYLELLQYSQDLESQGKSFWDEKEKYLEFLRYRILLNDHFYYQEKDQYVSLLKDFIDRKIDGIEFETKFLKMFNEDGDRHELFQTDFEKLKNFEPDPKSKGFSALLTTIFEDCDRFDPDPQEDYEISEAELRDSVRKIFLEIQFNFLQNF